MELIEIEDLVDCEFKNEGPIANVSGSLSYSDFFNNFLATNTPSIFEDNVTENWLCRSRWIDSSNAPNFIALQETFGLYISFFYTFHVGVEDLLLLIDIESLTLLRI